MMQPTRALLQRTPLIG